MKLGQRFNVLPPNVKTWSELWARIKLTIRNLDKLPNCKVIKYQHLQAGPKYKYRMRHLRSKVSQEVVEKLNPTPNKEEWSHYEEPWIYNYPLTPKQAFGIQSKTEGDAKELMDVLMKIYPNK